MFAETREQVRSHFIDVWRKMGTREPMEPLEQLLAAVIEHHPEYHPLLDRPESAVATDFGATGGTNPFLHMSLHVALHEQLQTDRPRGVVAAYETLREHAGLEPHQLEHRMIECLSASLWDAQQNARPPDEAAYLECLRRIR